MNSENRNNLTANSEFVYKHLRAWLRNPENRDKISAPINEDTIVESVKNILTAMPQHEVDDWMEMGWTLFFRQHKL